MKTGLFHVLLILSIYAPNSNAQGRIEGKNKSVVGISVNREFPVMDSAGAVIGYDPQYAEIYYYENQVLYKTPYTFTFLAGDGSILKEEHRFRYLTHTQGNKYGYYFDSSLSIVNKRVLVDSMLSKEWYSRDFLENIFEKMRTHMISEVSSEAMGTSTRVYSVRSSADSSQIATLQLTYSKQLKSIPFTFSKTMDQVKNMKLVEATIINYPRRIESAKMNIDTIKQTRRIQAIPVTNPSAIMKYLKRS